MQQKMKQSQAQLSADHETLQSLFGKHNYWKLLTPLLTLTAQVTKGNIRAELHATGSHGTCGY